MARFLVTSSLVVYTAHKAHAQVHSYTAYWKVCEVHVFCVLHELNLTLSLSGSTILCVCVCVANEW